MFDSPRILGNRTPEMIAVYFDPMGVLGNLKASHPT